MALPKYFDYASQAKESASKGTLGGVRAGVANFYANTAINGTPGYPTLTLELTTLGTVMQEVLPENPYNDDHGRRAQRRHRAEQPGRTAQPTSAPPSRAGTTTRPPASSGPTRTRWVENDW